MRRFGQLLVATLVRGILLLLPFTIIAVLVRETYRALLSVTRPLAAWLPIHPVFGLLLEHMLAIVLIMSAFLIAGLFVATRTGRALSDRLERLVLYCVPGYLLVRGAVGGLPGLQMHSDFVPVLARESEARRYSL